mmetsp:Transcript_28080/g.36797  ORF Transcript_28080/g.36797 Transcript_28080/m.36797 type:complete len:368 (-) Transcript_28080:40-1143(-)|eukprot:CAMPEP_0117759194 /NCGR_PEP_ID=MMETSP0947-20121206/15866_1 /TAXON_ID=44440 /ORGANISM="Chattonella subsalsa, Strain CCMP2191" /LENGTH=367 /DNA_ID=CAMNT_0005579601 /DNA_START=79 /DNA_END=1182 /DNA_ORIENTATION=-
MAYYPRSSSNNKNNSIRICVEILVISCLALVFTCFCRTKSFEVFGNNFIIAQSENINEGRNLREARQFVVFGDSYSDSGGNYGYISLFQDETNVIPHIPFNQYKGNRFTNGRTYMEYVASSAYAKLTNYAASYAQVLHSMVVTDRNTCKEVTVPSLQEQWFSYLNSSNFDTSNLHIIAIGANDLGYIAEAYAEGTMGLWSAFSHAKRVTEVILDQATNMESHGISKKNIVLVTFPAAWLIPYFIELGIVDDVEIAFMMEIILFIQKGLFKRSGFYYWDLAATMSELVDEDKALHKIVDIACFPYNSDGPALNGCPNYNSTVINELFGKGCNPDTVEEFTFFDTFHPTNASHYKLHEAFYGYLDDNVL